MVRIKQTYNYGEYFWSVRMSSCSLKVNLSLLVYKFIRFNLSVNLFWF